MGTIIRTSSRSLVDYFYINLSGDDYVKSPSFHHTLSTELLSGTSNIAIEAFRESGKTGLVFLAYPCYLLQFPRRDRSYVVLIKQNQLLAEDKLRQIAQSYLNNPVMKINLVRVNRSSGRVFDVVVRDYTGAEINIIMEAYGKGAALRGLVYQSRRPDIVLIDDPQDFEDSRSEAVLKRDWDWFLSDVKPLGKNTRIFMIGNNLGDTCLIERVLEHAENLEFKAMRIPALDAENIAAWPERFPTDFLLREKASYHAAFKVDIWYRERMCVAMSEERREFKREYLRYWSHEDAPKLVQIKMAIDPAISKKNTADYTGIVVAGKDVGHRIYILECVKKRLHPDEIIEEIFRLLEKWKVSAVGLENIAYQKMLILELRKQMQMRGKFFSLVELSARGEKEARIRSAMQARYAAGSVYHLLEHVQLEDELLTFPLGKNDDLIDAESNVISMLDMGVRQSEPLTYLPNKNKSTGDQELLEDIFAPQRGFSLRINYKR